MSEGPAAGLVILDALATHPQLVRWPQLHLARADLLARLGRREDALDAYRRALQLEPPAPPNGPSSSDACASSVVPERLVAAPASRRRPRASPPARISRHRRGHRHTGLEPIADVVLNMHDDGRRVVPMGCRGSRSLPCRRWVTLAQATKSTKRSSSARLRARSGRRSSTPIAAAVGGATSSSTLSSAVASSNDGAEPAASTC